MKKIFLVLQHEFLTALRRPSFLFFAFGLPLIVILVLVGVRLFKGADGDLGSESGSESESTLQVEGYVDRAGLITSLPPDARKVLIRYDTVESAEQALWSGEIEAYYLVPADYIVSGRFDYVHRQYNPIAEDGQDWIMHWTLQYNLTGGDLEFAQQVTYPAVVTVTDLSISEVEGASQACLTPGYRCESSVFLRYLPLIFLFTFFIAILSGSSLLVHGVAGEKENRVMEVLLVSVTPMQLLVGKVAGLGLLGLLQTGAWLSTSAFSLAAGGELLSIPRGFNLPVSVWFWGVLFFLLGYVVYASLMAAAGALLPDIKSYSGVTMIVAAPCYLAYMATMFLGYNPHGWMASGLSIFPLTAPMVMMWRIVQGGVPFWQLALAAVLLVVTAVFIIRAVERVFSARELLSGQAFGIGRYLKLLAGRSASSGSG